MDKITGALSVIRTVTGSLSNSISVTGKLTVPEVIDTRHYQGVYEFTPSDETQIIPTSGLKLTQDIVINPIPSNYGLVTWNGSQLTIS